MGDLATDNEIRKTCLSSLKKIKLNMRINFCPSEICVCVCTRTHTHTWTPTAVYLSIRLKRFSKGPNWSALWDLKCLRLLVVSCRKAALLDQTEQLSPGEVSCGRYWVWRKTSSSRPGFAISQVLTHREDLEIRAFPESSNLSSSR